MTPLDSRIESVVRYGALDWIFVNMKYLTLEALNSRTPFLSLRECDEIHTLSLAL